jgi:endonuclease III
MLSNQFFFDEMEPTGDQIRIKNKMKVKNLMALAVNFADEETLKKIQNVFLSLTPKELDDFRKFLDDRSYIRSEGQKSKEYKIITQLSRIALSAEPKDENLKKIYKEFKENLEKIDDLKIQTTKTIDGVKVNKLIEEIDIINDRNIELMEIVSKYRKNTQPET